MSMAQLFVQIDDDWMAIWREKMMSCLQLCDDCVWEKDSNPNPTRVSIGVKRKKIQRPPNL